jgi:hypothetical protein
MGRRGERKEGEESKEKASLTRRRPEPQERRERERGERESFSAASAKEAAQRPKEEAAPKAMSMKGAAKGAAARAEGAVEIHRP